MDSTDQDEREHSKNTICRLEWIAWAMEAARRYKEGEQPDPPPQDKQVDSESE